MSYQSELNDGSEIAGSLEPRANSWLRPTPIALITSVILHLLVYRFGLPYFDFETIPTKREVSIIELTPEQQSRLPNNLAPDLIPEPNIPNVNVPEVETPPSDLDSSVAPYALPPSLTPGIEGFPNLPPVAIPLPPEFDIPPLPPIPEIELEPPPIFDETSPSPEAETPDLQERETETSSPPPEPPQEEPKPEPEPAAAPPPEPQPEPEPSPQEIAAQRQQNLQQEVSSISSSLQKQSNATTDEDARKNYVAWLSRVEAIAPENIEIAGTYPRDACIRRLEGTTTFGVVVDASGKVVASDLIKGAEYSVFDIQGSKELAELNIENNTDQPKPYRVTFDYEYDSEICPSLTLPSLREKGTDLPQSEDGQSPETEADTPSQPEEATDAPQSEDAQTPEAEAEPPSLRERLRNVPLLPDERFDSPETPEE